MENIGGNAIVIKEININLVKKVLKLKAQATKQEIAKETGLSFVTVGTALQFLLSQNEIFETKLSPSNGGRPAQQYSYNYDKNYALILFPYENEQKTFIHTLVVNLAGISIYENDFEVKTVSLNSFETIIEPLLKEYPLIKVLGFGHHGVEINGEIIVSDYKELLGTFFAEHFRNLYNLSLIIENDVNAAVVGFGKRRKITINETLIYIHFPENQLPRAGIYLNDRLFKGKTNYAGEITTIPLNIAWNKALYESTDEVCESISKLIVTFCSILNPDTVIMSGKFLTQSHITNITQKCKERIPQNIVPRLYSSENFNIDYKRGLIAQTLEELEPNISLTRKRQIDI